MNTKPFSELHNKLSPERKERVAKKTVHRIATLQQNELRTYKIAIELLQEGSIASSVIWEIANSVPNMPHQDTWAIEIVKAATRKALDRACDIVLTEIDYDN